MAIKDRLIQFVLRGKDELSPEAKKSAEALDKVRTAGKELTEELDKAKGAQGLAFTLRTTSEATERARTTLERTEKKAADLREELNQSPKSKGLADSLRAAEREAARAGRQLDKLTAETKKTEDAAQAAGIDTRKLADEELRLAAEVDKAKRAVTDNTKHLRDMERQQRAGARATAEHTSRVDSAKKAMDSAGKRVLAFAAAYVSLNAAFRLVQGGLNLVRDGIRSMLDTGSEFELMQQRVTGLMGSIEEGERATAWISDFAKQTGQLIPDVTEAFALLKAYGLDPMDGSLKAITDKSVQLGGGMERLSGITAALGQMWAKEKIQQEEVLQLTERGVVVWPLLEKAMGKTTVQLQDMAQKGLLGRDAVKLLIDEIGKSADGAAAEGLETLTGKMNGLRNAASEFLNRIAESGAMDAVKDRLSALADQIDRMDQDGTLENLAQALSDAFVQGIEKVEEFAQSLGAVNFKQLADDSASWFRDFGQHIDDAKTRLQLFFAPFRTLFNGVTSGISVIGYTVTRVADGVLQVIGAVATAIPDMLGGDKLRAGVQSARNMLFGMREGFVAQIEQDGQDIRNAWDVTTQHSIESQQDVTAAAVAAEQAKLEAAQATAAKVDELNERFKQGALDAAVAGTRAITDMADAMKLIDTASTVQQLEGLKEALRDAYRAGNISQEEYNNGLNLTNARVKELGGNASTTAKRVDEMITGLETFADVQAAIEASTTEMDIIKLGAVIKQMYTDGKITAEEYKTALEDLAKEKERVTQATEEQAKAETQLTERVEKSVDALEARKRITNANKDATDEASASETRRTATIEKSIGVMVMGARRMAYYAAEAVAAAANSEKAEQARADSLVEGYSKGEMSIRSFIAQARTLQGSLNIDSSAFSTLESAIASAEQQMRSLGDSARSTLDGVRDELDRLQGNTEAIEKRRMASRRRELQAQLAEAKAAGNGQAVGDLQQAIGMLSAIASETAQVREQEERSNRRAPTEATAPGAGAQPAAATAAPTTVIRLESARGSAVDVAVPQGQEDALLSILEQSGLRTI
ncbi:tape measure domain-containing protein [Halopseudomonas litoralis]|uniref:Tape measure domain-containing protein n=1 Tax=Halopseudomonas litoralis TaxID=797277 RepID=A0A1H1QSR5_9GAMM|nr:tape measure protein [Halopseudomonas litoralis]SDS26510.1 tape measure domain-containing protein [Halopseudomonas litoralis]